MDATPPDPPPAPDPYRPPDAPIGRDRDREQSLSPVRSPRRPHIRVGFLWGTAVVLAGAIALLTVCSSR